MRKISSFILFLTLIFISFSLHAETQFGVQIYPGAKLEKEETKFLREVGGANSYCYKTNDPAKKVAEFFAKQPGVTSLGTDANGGMLIKEDNGHTVYIKVQNPWQPSKGGEMAKDTLIVITNE